MWAGHLLLPGTPVPLPWRAAVGGALLICAGLFGPRAIRTFSRQGTTLNPVRIDEASALVTSGVFARTRNPMYLSLALALLAWAAWLGQWPLLLGPIAFVLFITRFQILPEERVLSARFGAEYDRYRARVRRWL